jgi:predicted NAD/FAD-dependent oxidoreductase
LIALYEAAPRGADAWPPRWDVSYPESSPVLQLIANDASKRAPGAPLILVYQAHARWSRAHLEDERWPEAMLTEAARLLGPAAAQPTSVEPHRWRFARTDRSGELTAPLLLRLADRQRLGLCGEIFAPGAGVEAAWVSGERLARRILAEAG